MRIDLLLKERKSYTFEGYAAAQVGKALQEKGIAFSTLYLGEGVLHDYLAYAKEHPPTLTLSFAETTPLPVCEVLRVPHVCWVENSIAFTLHYLNTLFGKLAIPDRQLVERLDPLKAFYLPHGVEPVTGTPKRCFEVVYFGSLVDDSFLEAGWKILFNEEEEKKLRHAITCRDPLLAGPLYYYAEQALQARTHTALITSWKASRLDVFGEHVGANWLTRLPNREQIYLHSALPYSEHFAVLASSLLCVASPESPWYLPALAAGCLPVSDQSEVPFLLSSPAERAKRLSSLQQTTPLPSWSEQLDRLLV